MKNYLANHRSLHERVENAAVVQSLVDHPGWALMEEIVGEAVARSDKALAAASHKAAMDADPQQSLAYAQKYGLHHGLTYHRDVVASVLDSAKTAAAELKRTAALDEPAGRN